ncbi:gamma-glutamylcyclotransferase [Cognatishimia maritima]|uniref:glutathione-specific gamma-glutamylcyclotransferase n=1 Tax=Cognatishimia maritima TaxID=870908 RepID=A0A1M5RFU3_9RHOB|nr:gamma-glutamylcyclotransferase [Cognatishimia maritima]SHH25068.1 cation transport protein ChaC [Cognatishimia maritima]
MADIDDPFRHHPNLRHLIKPAAQSTIRNFKPGALLEMIKQHGAKDSDLLTDAERDADRRAALRQRPDGALWVFGYGSLIWDPGIDFAEVRRAHAPHWQRRFIVKDVWGGRGTKDQPGVMAALDQGDGCHGLIFRITEAAIESETQVLWNRERVGRAYKPAFIDVTTDAGPLKALTFVVDHEAEIIDSDMTWDEQVHFCATGTGSFGTSFEYVENLVRHFHTLKIDAPHACALLEAAKAYQAAHRAS